MEEFLNLLSVFVKDRLVLFCKGDFCHIFKTVLQSPLSLLWSYCLIITAKYNKLLEEGDWNQSV